MELSLVVSTDINFFMGNIHILFREPLKGIEQSNSIQIILSGLSANLLVCAGLVKGIHIVTCHCLKLFPDTGVKPFELEIIRFRVPAGVDIKVNKQVVIQQNVLGLLHLHHRLHQLTVGDSLHDNFAVDHIRVLRAGNHQATVR